MVMVTWFKEVQEVTRILTDADETKTHDHVEDDGVDWCAWWAEYAETME
jgi:hypothetical protein